MEMKQLKKRACDGEWVKDMIEVWKPPRPNLDCPDTKKYKAC